MIFFFFGETILYLWTQNPEMANRSSVVFRLLSIGNLLNGLNTMPYLLQLAFGWTSLVTRINFVAVLIIVPSLVYVTPIFGALGAASAWVMLNAGYILIGIHFMFRKLLVTEKWTWFLNDVFIPVIVATVVAFLFSFIMPSNLSYWLQLFYLFIAGAFVFIATSFSTLYMRNSIYFMIQYIQKRTRNSQVENSNN
jgi:O-antigen/teichoic acid export membrane protein